MQSVALLAYISSAISFTRELIPSRNIYLKFWCHSDLHKFLITFTDHKEIEELRQNIPLTTQRRLNVYSRASSSHKSKDKNPVVKKTAEVSGYNIDVNQHID